MNTNDIISLDGCFHNYKYTDGINKAIIIFLDISYVTNMRNTDHINYLGYKSVWYRTTLWLFPTSYAVRLQHRKRSSSISLLSYRLESEPKTGGTVYR